MHRLLIKSASAEIKSRFPLLRHQWPLVTKFRSQIIERVMLKLRSGIRTAPEEAAVCLGAAAFLEDLTSAQVGRISSDAYLRCLTSSRVLALAIWSSCREAICLTLYSDLVSIQKELCPSK